MNRLYDNPWFSMRLQYFYLMQTTKLQIWTEIREIYGSGETRLKARNI